MPKVGASMADISTEYQNPDPAAYIFEVVEATYDEKTEKAPKSGLDVVRGTHKIKSKIVSLFPEEETEHSGKPVTDFINIHTKEGEPNEISLAQLKRYFEAIIPERADAEDADTEELVGGRFVAQLRHRKSNQPGDDRVFAEIKGSTISPVE